MRHVAFTLIEFLDIFKHTFILFYFNWIISIDFFLTDMTYLIKCHLLKIIIKKIQDKQHHFAANSVSFISFEECIYLFYFFLQDLTRTFFRQVETLKKKKEREVGVGRSKGDAAYQSVKSSRSSFFFSCLLLLGCLMPLLFCAHDLTTGEAFDEVFNKFLNSTSQNIIKIKSIKIPRYLTHSLIRRKMSF